MSHKKQPIQVLLGLIRDRVIHERSVSHESDRGHHDQDRAEDHYAATLAHRERPGDGII